jgi:outer membrane receptor protein involved in Fe transport
MRKTKRPVTAFAKKSCVTATQLALAMMAAPLALAQQAEVQKGERIEITGTRIPSPNLESTSPVAVIGAGDIKFEGVRNVENLLNNLPQVFADQGSTYANGAIGTAQVNLRGQGSDRTLVLVNGKRLPPGSPKQGGYSADLNQIPAPLIQRIEVLTGGASAVYGSDAVAGVVNFILRDNFEGVQGEVNYGWYQHDQHNAVASVVAARSLTAPTQFRVPGDKSTVGESTETSLMIGGNFGGGKGNATVFLGYKKEKPILQADYDYSACSLGSTATSFTCAGSGTSFPGQFLIGPTFGVARTVADANGGVRPYNGTADAFNFAPYNMYQRPDDRYTAHVTAHYDVNPHARVYADFGFHDDHTVGQIAPSGLFGVFSTQTFENPLLSAAWRTTLGLTGPGTTQDVIILRRNLEGGGRQADLRHTSFRTVAGIKGDIFKNWDYDIFMQTGQVIYQEVYKNDFSIIRGQRALDVVADANGNPVCRSALDGTDLNCVPYNIWRLGGVTPEALAYLQTPGLARGSTTQRVQGATLTGDLGNYGWRFPGSKAGIGVAVGIERRVEKLNLDVDTEFETGDLAGQGGPTHGVSGQFTVKEVFVEARVPIRDIFSVNGSYRYSDYSTGVSTDTYGVGFEVTPHRVVKFRGSYQQAVRAPNVVELFAPQGLALYDNDADPCAGSSPSATLAQCQRTGVTASQYGSILDSPAGQYNYIQGGNPQLQPEKGKSYTFGFVLQPMRNLSATIDYFNIKVDNVISNLSPPVVLQECLTNNRFCDLIHRDQLGTLWLLPTAFIVGTNLNLAKQATSGYDINVNYNHKLGRWGGLGVNFIGTYLKELIYDQGLGEFDCVGLYGTACGTPNPEWRHKLRFTWSTPWQVDLAATWRHFDAVLHARTSSNPQLRGTVAAPDRELGARDYLDIAVQWAFRKNMVIRGGINNVFDRDPPISGLVGAGAGNGNTFPQVYDAAGRRLFVGAQVNF